jgi:uncharacterized protein (TIGR00730 family)
MMSMQDPLKISQVCVYCGSSSRVHEVYLQTAQILADVLVDNHITVVYGGGQSGLMGKLADRVLERNGRIIGIMPHFMDQVELAHKGVKEFHLVGDMHERKKKFLDGTDALITLPGGCGTLEELLEAITFKHLGIFSKPIIIVNINGFFDPMITMLDRCIKEKFMNENTYELWTVIDNPAHVVEAIQKSPVYTAGILQSMAKAQKEARTRI